MQCIVRDDDGNNLSDQNRSVLVGLTGKQEIQDDPRIEFYPDSPVLFPDLGHPAFDMAAGRIAASGFFRKPDLPLVNPQAEQRLCRYDPGRQIDDHLARQSAGGALPPTLDQFSMKDIVSLMLAQAPLLQVQAEMGQLLFQRLVMGGDSSLL